MAYKIAVVGATGNVGREMLKVLVQRQFPVSEVVALASSRSVGTEVSFGDDAVLKVKALEHFDFTGTDIALMSAGGSVAKEWAPRIAAQGCLVIDNSSAWRMDRQVPLVVPEVNADALNDIPKGIIANPNCSTAQLVVALKPLHDLFKIKRVVVSTYQSVSGAGNEAMDELFRQTRAIFVADPIEQGKFTKQIAFNVIPHIDVFMDSGLTKEEWKMAVETQKILDPDIQVTATCVRVPVFVGHSESVNIEFELPVTADKARAALRAAPGILVVDKREDGGYVTPIECAGEDATFVSRVRKDPTVENGLNLWIVSDNLRKGAALNAVQIAESLMNRNLLKGIEMPKAYWIARVDVDDAEEYKKYVETGKPAFARYNAKFLARGGKTEQVEGTGRARNVVIEFPSLQDALDCYNSPEYSAARAIRQKVSQGEWVLVEGVE